MSVHVVFGVRDFWVTWEETDQSCKNALINYLDDGCHTPCEWLNFNANGMGVMFSEDDGKVHPEFLAPIWSSSNCFYPECDADDMDKPICVNIAASVASVGDAGTAATCSNGDLEGHWSDCKAFGGDTCDICDDIQSIWNMMALTFLFRLTGIISCAVYSCLAKVCCGGTADKDDAISGKTTE